MADVAVGSTASRGTVRALVYGIGPSQTFSTDCRVITKQTIIDSSIAEQTSLRLILIIRSIVIRPIIWYVVATGSTVVVL